MGEDKSIDQRLREIIEFGFSKHKAYTRVPLPSESRLGQFDENTRRITSQLLERILDAGDSYTCHRELNYTKIHALQLDLLNHIIYCEETIQSFRKVYKKSSRVEELKKRRATLRLLGSTIAWILLEFDAAYVRAMSRSYDQGYIVNKRGSPAELLAFIAGNHSKEETALIHHITLCMRIGDLTFVNGSLHRPIEIKTDYTKKRRRPDRRERRQRRRGNIQFEFYAKRESDKVHAGIRSVRRNTKKRDVHHWETLTLAAERAELDGYSLVVAERGIAYGICHNLGQMTLLIDRLLKVFPKPLIFAGSLDHHMKGLPEVMPFTLFDIPLKLKKEILLGDSIAIGFIDINGVGKTLGDYGFDAEPVNGGISMKVREVRIVMSGNPLERLRYECLSTETLRDYALLVTSNSTLNRLEKRPK